MNREFKLPDSFRDLVGARHALKRDFKDTNLEFSLDGKLVGDVGEALAIRHLGLVPCTKKRRGIDGTVGEKSVQVKASASKRGAACRWVEPNADHLLVFCINPDENTATLIFNGPQNLVLIERFENQRQIPRDFLIQLDNRVPDDQRLPIVNAGQDG